MKKLIMIKLIHVLPASIAGYAVWQVIRINQQYPLKPLPAASKLPELLSTDDLRFDSPDFITARVKLASASPLESYLQAFWSTWTLQVEGFLAKNTGYQSHPESRHAEVFAHGIFPVESRSATSLVVGWGMPGSVLSLCGRLGIPMVAGGRQELSVHQVGEHEFDLGYACAQHYGELKGKDEGVRGRDLGLALHRFYMRFLLDSAVRKLKNGVQ